MTRSIAVFARLQGQQIAAIDKRGPRRERLRRDFEIAGLHLGHVENAVDHRQQMLAGIVDQLRIFLAARRVEHHRVFLHDHLGEADDGVQRRAQFVAHGGEEAGLGRVRLFGGGARQLERLLLDLAVGDVAHHGDDVGSTDRRIRRWLFERPATHFDPDEIGGIVLPAANRRVAPETKFDAARLAAARGIRQRGEIGRTIDDMDAIEQAMADEPRTRRAQHRFRGRRNELHRAVAAMMGNHVAHVSRQQAIAVFLDIEQRDAGARQRFRADCKSGGIERRRGYAEAAIRRAQRRVRSGRQQAKCPSTISRRCSPAPAPMRTRPRGARPTARLRGERRSARSRQRIRCRRWSLPKS